MKSTISIFVSSIFLPSLQVQFVLLLSLYALKCIFDLSYLSGLIKMRLFCLDSFFVRLRQVETLVWMVLTLFVLSVGKQYLLNTVFAQCQSVSLLFKCPFERVQSKTNCVTIFCFLGCALAIQKASPTFFWAH